ncbi:MAG: AzlD domain-containing protein [Deltaproteobacteria bacterium]|jgi:branched-subunit amino acid transport protein|nr:AzlD domain-containing protein [Deltaproteobacteria bacterium]MCW9049074.1 AzlD domain-containing protein [Deltaproteobacteria bacterium]
MLADSSTLWPVILGIGAGTFLIRFSFIWLLGRSKVNTNLQRLLQFVPPAVLSALIMPSFIFPQQAEFSLENYRMWAGLFAGLVAWRTKNVLLTIASGLIALWILSLLGS